MLFVKFITDRYYCPWSIEKINVGRCCLLLCNMLNALNEESSGSKLMQSEHGVKCGS